MYYKTIEAYDHATFDKKCNELDQDHKGWTPLYPMVVVMILTGDKESLTKYVQQWSTRTNPDERDE